MDNVDIQAILNVVEDINEKNDSSILTDLKNRTPHIELSEKKNPPKNISASQIKQILQSVSKTESNIINRPSDPTSSVENSPREEKSQTRQPVKVISTSKKVESNNMPNESNDDTTDKSKSSSEIVTPNTHPNITSLFGYNIPTSTLYFIIILIVIAITIFLTTIEKKKEKEVADDEKKENDE